MIFLAKRNNGVRSPEMRLWLGYPATILSSLGLLIWGLSIGREWHWITGQIAFFLCKETKLQTSIPCADECDQMAQDYRLGTRHCRAISSTATTSMLWIS